MKKTILVLSLISLIWNTQAFSETPCFLAKEKNIVLQQEGDCQKRYAPESTFKIALSLIGYDTGILKDEKHPEWSLKPGDDYFINVCKSSHHPQTWMRDSCVWYSQVLTRKLGFEKFKKYIIKFNYGNLDISGEKGKKNGLTHSWLSSSLEISPEEQIIFLQKLIDKKLSIKNHAYDMTKKIMYIQTLPGGWKLYGKTGNGRLLTADRMMKTDFQHGWFIGWIEKEGRIIAFSNHIEDDKNQAIFASFRARNEALIKLWYLINDLEK